MNIYYDLISNLERLADSKNNLMVLQTYDSHALEQIRKTITQYSKLSQESIDHIKEIVNPSSFGEKKYDSSKNGIKKLIKKIKTEMIDYKYKLYGEFTRSDLLELLYTTYDEKCNIPFKYQQEDCVTNENSETIKKTFSIYKDDFFDDIKDLVTITEEEIKDFSNMDYKEFEDMYYEHKSYHILRIIFKVKTESDT